MRLSTTVLGIDPELISALEELQVNKEETPLEPRGFFFSSTNPNWYTAISVVLLIIYLGTFFGLTQFFLILMPASIALLLGTLFTFFLYSMYTLTLIGSFSASQKEDKNKEGTYFFTYFIKYFFTTVIAAVLGVLSCIGWMQSEEISGYLSFQSIDEIGILPLLHFSMSLGGNFIILCYILFSLAYFLPHLFTDLFLNKPAIKNSMRTIQNEEINELMKTREYPKIEELKKQWIDQEMRDYSQKAIAEPNLVLSNTYTQMMDYYSKQNI